MEHLQHKVLKMRLDFTNDISEDRRRACYHLSI